MISLTPHEKNLVERAKELTRQQLDAANELAALSWMPESSRPSALVVATIAAALAQNYKTIKEDRS